MTESTLAQILQQPHVWRGRTNEHADQTKHLATGWAELDQPLSGGWPRAAVTEILVTHPGQGELGLLMPALRRLCTSGRRVLWVAPPTIPYAPALAQHQLDLSLIRVVHCSQPENGLWAAEQALRSGACSAVLCWPEQINERRFRRLQLAAEAGDSWCVVFRNSRFADSGSPAALRLLVSCQDQQPRVEILKQRGGRPHSAVALPPSSAHPKVPAIGPAQGCSGKAAMAVSGQ